jgi:hypothetical protein
MLTIADIFEPSVWQEVVAEKSKETNRFIMSGVALNTAEFDALANTPGKTVDMPYWKAVTYEEPDVISDDENVTSTASEVGQGIQIARKSFLHKSWGVMSLAQEIQGLEDPVSYVTSKLGGYWASADEARTIASAQGILADSVANHNSDLVINIATDDAGTPTDAELISPEAIINATALLGDQMESLSVIAMHSICYALLKKQNLIDFKETSDPRFGMKIPFYLDMMVIVDDSLPVEVGTNRNTYTSILYSQGAFGIGFGTPEYPLELERKASVGNGGGADILHSRETNIIHPRGFQFTSANVAGDSATLAELKNATNWTRVYESRKNIPVAFLKTNG